MNPFQHGEVFVTDDGTETDLDLGHYERFLDRDLPGSANVTTGQVYSAVIAHERSGGYLGQTVQVVPHITDEIKQRILKMATPDVDVVITEIGGTVGDIESLPFLEAARQIRTALGRDRTFFVHVSLLPYMGPAAELKTKPTQHSVVSLRSIGISPDAIVLRCDRAVPDHIAAKVSDMCDVPRRGVVAAPDAATIWDIPRTLHSAGFDAYLVQRLGLPFTDVDWTEWGALLDRVHHPHHEIVVGLVGKYVDLPDAYLSVTEAIRAAGFARHAHVTITWIPSDTCETPTGADDALRGCDALVVPGGFGVRGIEGKIGALRWARRHRVPTLGLCLGMQAMVIEHARAAGMRQAHSTEFEPATPHPVITLLDEQHHALTEGQIGGTMRLGGYDASLLPGSVTADAYGTTEVRERHRHRYEVNPQMITALELSGLTVSGRSTGTGLVEFVELPADVHPFYVGTQAHPEFQSRPTRPHPLFVALISAVLSDRM